LCLFHSAEFTLKVIRIVENLHRGAVESWLVRMFERCSRLRPELKWTFYCALGEPGRWDEKVTRLGGEIIYSPVPFGRTRRFVAELRKVLRAGRFDILHAHHDLLSGFYLLAAAGLPIGLRIVHVHNTDEALPTPSRIKQMLLKEPLRWINRHFADKVVGIADHTLRTFCHGRHPRAGRDEVLYYGCDLSAFQGRPVDRQAFRARLGLAEDARLVLFLGRVVAIKNPLFALDVFRELAAKDPRAVFLVAGDGPLRGEVERRARDCGIEARVRVMGWCDTPAEVMGSCDLFLFPRSEHNVEGFGLAVLEAQAAGLPVLVSNGVSREVALPPGRFEQLPLAAGAAAWADRSGALLAESRPAGERCLAWLRDSAFSVENGARNLLSLYPPEARTAKTCQALISAEKE
jgi:glycosyltransferase involved in cell wall biosynthesis